MLCCNYVFIYELVDIIKVKHPSFTMALEAHSLPPSLPPNHLRLIVCFICHYLGKK